MSSREIISLQFGHYSNFVGTHWWNTQELSFDYTEENISDINHDILYREGVNPQGHTTYTPRLLLVDLKGSLKTLPLEGELYKIPNEIKPDEVLWPNVEVKKDTSVEKNEFLKNLDTDLSNKCKINNLEKNISVWSDFMYARFHPRTVHCVKEYTHNNTEVPFDLFPMGRTLWNADFQENFDNDFRKYIEECNSLQGFHVTLDSTNGFAGLSTACLQYLFDEYDKKTAIVFAVAQPGSSDSNLSNLVLCYEQLAELNTLFVPLSIEETCRFPNLIYDVNSDYQTSAILAAALDTITMVHRKRTDAWLLSDVCSKFTNGGRYAAAASVNLPFGLRHRQHLIDCLDQWEGPLLQSLTHGCLLKCDPRIQLVTVRGITEDKLKADPSNAREQQMLAAYRCNSVKEMLQLYLTCSSPLCSTSIITSQTSINVKQPFPNIFSEQVNNEGFISETSRHSSESVKEAPIIGGLHTGTEVGSMVQSLYNKAKSLRKSHLLRLLSTDIEWDEYKESLDHIADLADCYHESDIL